MGLMDTVKGWLSGDTIQSALETTGLGDQVNGLLGDGAASLGAAGEGLTQAADGVASGEVLPAEIGEVIPGLAEGGTP